MKCWDDSEPKLPIFIFQATNCHKHSMLDRAASERPATVAGQSSYADGLPVCTLLQYVVNRKGNAQKKPITKMTTLQTGNKISITRICFCNILHCICGLVPHPHLNFTYTYTHRRTNALKLFHLQIYI